MRISDWSSDVCSSDLPSAFHSEIFPYFPIFYTFFIHITRAVEHSWNRRSRQPTPAASGSAAPRRNRGSAKCLFHPGIRTFVPYLPTACAAFAHHFNTKIGRAHV